LLPVHSQHAAHHGYFPSWPSQYFFAGLPFVQTAPAHPFGLLGPFMDCGSTEQSSGVGSGVGFGVGSAVGFGVGFAVGSGVGFGVGSTVGFGVGFTVGFGVGSGVAFTQSYFVLSCASR
jgi:hypothetical protein